MITELYIPTVKLKDDFDYGRNIEDSEYERMVDDEYNRTHRDIDNFMSYGVRKNGTYPQRFEIRPQKNDENIYQYNEVQATIKDIEANDLAKEELYKHVTDGDMFVILSNINSDTLDEDSESELIFWVKDSMKINNDRTINEDKKILYLPKRDLKIKLDEQIFSMLDCKILDNYGNVNQGQFNFALLIKQIVKK